MKRQSMLALGLLVLSSSAFASKARLEALGEDAGGSQFISDFRNVFLNPAHANTHKDFVTVEWGNTENREDKASSPRAEGGVFKSAGSMVTGLYFGNESTTSNNLRSTLLGSVDVDIHERNNVDVLVAGDSGLQWGAKLTHSSSQADDGDTKQSATRLAGGVVLGDLDIFAHVGVGNTVKTAAAKVKGKSSLDTGVTYNMNDMALMARMQTISAENTTTDVKYDATNTWVGVGKSYKLNEKANLWTQAWYKMDKSKNDSAKTESTYLPISIGFEVNAKEWLAFRASVVNNTLIAQQSKPTKDTVGNTTVAAGASLLFGELQFDGMIGNSDETDTYGTSTAGGNGGLRSDTLMSRVSMTYKF